jgi:hypothetical protein
MMTDVAKIYLLPEMIRMTKIVGHKTLKVNGQAYPSKNEAPSQTEKGKGDGTFSTTRITFMQWSTSI